MIMQPILSICIPTYNRANWLRSSLWNWLPQVKQANGLVELIVCDNASPDNTKQVIEEARGWGDFQYHCNLQNIGAIGNIYRLVKDLAQGKFVWIVGDDDLPNVNALQAVINLLKDCSDVSYIYVNYSYWNPSKEQQEKQLLEAKDLDFSQVLSLDLETRFVNRVAEIVPLDFNCFTPIYCSIMRKQDACKAFQYAISQELFSSIEATIPHALYIAKNLLNQNAWYIGHPCILASYEVSWSNFSMLYFVEYIPTLYRIIEANGGRKSDLDLHRKKLLNRMPNFVVAFRSHKSSNISKLYITFKRYVNYPLIGVLGKDINYIFNGIQNHLARMKRSIQINPKE
jgi:glycosyltransferase involved in cell wall biosynthesis